MSYNNEIKYLDSQILTLKSNSRLEMCSNPSMIHNVQIIISHPIPNLTFTYYRFNGEKYSTNITFPCIINIKNAHIQYVEFSSSIDYDITFIKQPISMPITYTSHIANEISIQPLKVEYECIPFAFYKNFSPDAYGKLYDYPMLVKYIKINGSNNFKMGNINYIPVYVNGNYEASLDNPVDISKIYIKNMYNNVYLTLNVLVYKIP